MLAYRVTPGCLMVKGNGFEQSYVITRSHVSDYATWINEPTWDRGIPFPRQEDIFGTLGCAIPGQREIHRWAAFHTAKMMH